MVSIHLFLASIKQIHFHHLAHTQVKYSTQLYSKLLLRALTHDDFRMRLVAVIAIGETAIDNLTFQMKVTLLSLDEKEKIFDSLSAE